MILDAPWALRVFFYMLGTHVYPQTVRRVEHLTAMLAFHRCVFSGRGLLTFLAMVALMFSEGALILVGFVTVWTPSSRSAGGRRRHRFLL